jgi:DNA-binding response OmpR family regulator
VSIRQTKLLTIDKMKRILLVDDESDVCLVLEKALIEHGYVVDSYEHPLVALDKFKPYLYNLVILDIRMPDLNGFALYREIKRLDKKVKICFLTAGGINSLLRSVFRYILFTSYQLFYSKTN